MIFFRPSLSILFVLFLAGPQMTGMAQQVPCYKKKKICNYQFLTNCYEKVAFDSVSQRYYSRQNFGVPFDGSCATCHRNGVVEQEITIVEGRRNGTDTSYYPSGCPFSSQSFLLGKPHGKSSTYYDSTFRIKSEIEHYMGRLNGVFISYNKQGDTLKYQQFQENLPNGLKKEYFSDSRVKKISNYQMGLLHGCQILYNEDGNELYNIAYYEGKKNDKWTYYFDDQKIARVEEWSKGLKNGEFITYNSSEKIMSESYFKKDLPIGIHKEYYADGREKHVRTYLKKGLLEEEYAFDNFGVKEVIKAKGIKKKKRKREEQKESLMN
mgnify:FL=1